MLLCRNFMRRLYFNTFDCIDSMGQKLEGITTLIWEYVCELKKSILGTVVYYNKAKEQELFQFLRPCRKQEKYVQ